MPKSRKKNDGYYDDDRNKFMNIYGYDDTDLPPKADDLSSGLGSGMGSSGMGGSGMGSSGMGSSGMGSSDTENLFSEGTDISNEEEDEDVLSPQKINDGRRKQSVKRRIKSRKQSAKRRIKSRKQSAKRRIKSRK